MEPAGSGHRAAVHHGHHSGEDWGGFSAHQPHHHPHHESAEDRTRYDPLPPPAPLVPLVHPSSMTHSLTDTFTLWSLSQGRTFKVPCKTRPWDSPLCHFCMAGLSRVIRPDGTEKRSTEKEREKYREKDWERGERWGKIAEGGGEPRHIKSVSELSCKRLRLGIEGINERREGRGEIKGRGGGDE